MFILLITTRNLSKFYTLLMCDHCSNSVEGSVWVNPLWLKLTLWAGLVTLLPLLCCRVLFSFAICLFSLWVVFYIKSKREGGRHICRYWQIYFLTNSSDIFWVFVICSYQKSSFVNWLEVEKANHVHGDNQHFPLFSKFWSCTTIILPDTETNYL